ncbi:hypothetical protein VAR608DRAFT_4047 [Variovorax sp. HW608]|uniref:hypothetical protein n=1 Tax=Variovorax sp. HW608 TaxID=1034889 RepID=UPI00082019DF|nr:hypothetical protein [Variovorax sp. HW608]SCK42310.1 hypothetical protein VAR608DRAFT_4047 [Variovorax sp. HW608]
MTSETSEITCLQPGQALRVAVDEGFAVRVLEGSVQVVSPPAWFGENVFNVKSTVQAEEVHVVERGGWIEIVALSAARVQGLPRPAPVSYVNGTRVGRLVQLLTGALAWRS